MAELFIEVMTQGIEVGIAECQSNVLGSLGVPLML